MEERPELCSSLPSDSVSVGADYGYDAATRDEWHAECDFPANHGFGQVMWNGRLPIFWLVVAIIAAYLLSLLIRWAVSRIMLVGQVRFRAEAATLTEAARSRLYVVSEIKATGGKTRPSWRRRFGRWEL